MATASRLRRVKFDESLHPRSGIGRFISAEGGSSHQPSAIYGRQRAAFENSETTEPNYQITEAYRNLPVTTEPYQPGELGAIREYQNSAALINGYARMGDDAPLMPEAKERVRGEIASLDSAIERTALKEDTVVYRGVSGESVGWDGLRAGNQVVDPGFMSTSMDPATSRRFGDDLMEIRLPAGTNVALPSQEGERHSTEAEVLLGRGAVLQVRDVQRDEDDYGDVRWRYVADLVGYVED